MQVQCPNCQSLAVRNWYRASLVLALILALGVAAVLAALVLIMVIAPVLAGDTSSQSLGIAALISVGSCLIGLTPAAILFRLNRRWYRCDSCALMFQLR